MTNPNSGLILFIVVLALVLIAMIGLLHSLWRKSTRLQRDLRLSKEKNSELERLIDHHRSQNQALLGVLIGSVDTPVDILSEAQRIQHQINKVSAAQTVEETFDFISMLTRSMENHADLHPIAPYHQVVQFDPDLHIADHVTKMGSRVLVIETGWRMGNEIIKKALVTRVRE